MGDVGSLSGKCHSAALLVVLSYDFAEQRRGRRASSNQSGRRCGAMQQPGVSICRKE